MFRWIRITFFRIITTLTLRLSRVIATREFHSLTEEDVERMLVNRKLSIEIRYGLKDIARRSLAEVSESYRSSEDSVDVELSMKCLRREEAMLVDSHRKYDFARGLAYLVGFGKIVDKVSQR